MAKLDITTKAVAESKLLHLKDAEDNLLFTEEPGIGDGVTGEVVKPVRTPVTIPVFGPGSQEHAQAEAKRSTRNLERLRKKGQLKISADDELTENAEYLADVTGAFSANFSYPPADHLSGRAFRVAVFSDRLLGFLGDQIADERKDWASFTKGSAKS